MAIKQKIESLIKSSNAVTGMTDEDLTAAIKSLIDGYGSGHQYEVYSGTCGITPKAEAQVLDTKQKLMPDDVVVNPIPFFETTNLSGGETAYIGSEVE